MCVPERREDAVSHKDAEAVHQRQLQADVVEVVVGARQQVPGHQLLRGEPLGHLSKRDRGQSQVSRCVFTTTNRKVAREVEAPRPPRCSPSLYG